MDTQLEQSKQTELKLKNRIIEKLQKQLQYQNLRASEYEAKFRQAVLDNYSKKGDEQLLYKIIQKQTEINDLRTLLLEANRKINDSSNREDVDELIKQNTQMRNVVEQIKNAAVAAILQKDAQIQQLKQHQQVSTYDLIQQIAQLQAKNIQLENQQKKIIKQYQQEIKKLSEKVSEERNGFSEKLTKLQREYSQQQHQKESLLQQTQNLYENLSDMEKMVQKYEAKLTQYELLRSSDKVTHAKIEYELSREIERLNEDLKTIQKNEQEAMKSIITQNKTIEDQRKKIETLTEQKEELDRKLKIKNRKNNNKQNSKSIYESFEGFSQKADVYASFAKKQQKDMTKQSFIEEPIKLSDIKQIEIEQIQNFSEYMPDLEHNNQNLEEIKSNNNSLKSQMQAQASLIAGKNEKIQQLQAKIKGLLNEIEGNNKKMNQMTKQIQKQRQDKLELNKKYSAATSQYKVQKQSSRLHVYKLENALLVEKLQRAEALDLNKQIREYQKAYYEQQIKKLKSELQNPKKKKGFFK